MSATGPIFAADAPPASDSDTPTSPKTGTTSLFRPVRFEGCFVRGMLVLPCLPKVFVAGDIGTFCTVGLQGD